MNKPDENNNNNQVNNEQWEIYVQPEEFEESEEEQYFPDDGKKGKASTVLLILLTVFLLAAAVFLTVTFLKGRNGNKQPEKPDVTSNSAVYVSESSVTEAPKTLTDAITEMMTGTQAVSMPVTEAPTEKGKDTSGKSDKSEVSGTPADKKTEKESGKDSKPASSFSTTTPSKVEKATYISGVLVVNKTYALPSDYAPGVNSEARKAFNTMAADAEKEGISLWIRSGYRSYETQKNIYNNYVAQDGKAEADRYSARPGHSEHQTGLAFDVNSLSQSFESTPEGKWLAKNCWKYGFIIRYPKGKESITGYMYEPWHIRYLGTDTAKKVYNSGLTLEEYLGINSKYKD